MTEEKSHRSIEIQYGILFIKNNKKCNIVSLFPALVIPKTYIVLICTVVPKDFQRSFLGSKLLLIACSVVEGVWGVEGHCWEYIFWKLHLAIPATFVVEKALSC